MKKIKFLRRLSERHIKLGKGRKKKQKWRRPRGRDNKMREKRKGYPAVVSIGYKKSKRDRKEILKVDNLKELEKIPENQGIILGKMGKKKKIEIIEKAKEKGIKIINVNAEELLKKPKENPKISSKKTKEVKNESKE